MKINKLAFLFITTLILPTTLIAQNQTDPITATISINKPEVYERETFSITLTITTTGIQIRPKMNISNLPDPNKISIINEFQSLPVKRSGRGHRIVEISRYRCRARAMVTGTIKIAPTLDLVAMQRKRAFIGSFWEEHPLKLKLPAVKIVTKPLPTPPDNFSGAVGALNFSASIYPKDVAPGDLITLTTKISGLGYTDNIKNFSVPTTKNTNTTQQIYAIKAYAPELIDKGSDQITFDQIVIPQSTNVTAIPKIGFTFFDTRSGKYREISQGPFPIKFHKVETATVEQYKPKVVKSDIKKVIPKKEKTSLLQRVMRAMGHVRYEQELCNKKTNAHLAPSTTSPVSFTIPSNSKISIINQYNGWHSIEYKNKRGWIKIESTKKAE